MSSYKQNLFMPSFLQSKRNTAEQLLGLFVFLSISFFFYLVVAWLTNFHFSQQRFTLASLFLNYKIFSIGWLLFYSCLGIGLWMAWKKFSSKTLLIEITLLFWILFLSLFWFYLFEKTSFHLTSLICVLFISFSNILIFLSSWKKEKKSSFIFFFCQLWLFFIDILNFEVCIFI